jgi:hypothetical protein
MRILMLNTILLSKNQGSFYTKHQSVMRMGKYFFTYDRPDNKPNWLK